MFTNKADSEQRKKKLVKKSEKKENESKQSERIKGHYARTFYYSFMVSFIIFGLIAIFIFIYTKDKNFFGFSQKYYDRAVEYMEKGDIDAAQKELEGCLNFDEKYTRARTLLADIYISRGAYAEAEELLARSVELNPRSIDSYLEYIKVLAAQNKFDVAFSFIDNISSSYMAMKVKEKLPSTPMVSPSPGNYDSEIEITLTSDSDATIYYTVDGSVPNYNSSVYNGDPIVLSKNSINLRAVASNPEGYISGEASSLFSVYNSNTEYEFVDSKVESIIRKMINKKSGTIVYGDLESITTFSNVSTSVSGEISTLEDLCAIPNLTSVVLNDEKSIDDFSSLPMLTNVKSLDLTGCNVSSEGLKSISKMNWLESLSLDGCSVSDVSEISKLVKLKSLSLENNNLKDIAPLSTLTNLMSLNLSENFIDDISAVSEMTKLKTLNISNNLISSISALSELDNVKELKASKNKISSIDVLKKLTTLTTLDLSQNAISNIAPLSTMTSLVNINISSNRISSLSDLSKLSNLTTLNVNKNTVKDFDVLSGTNVRNLYAKSAGLDDASLKKISTLSKIQTLDISDNKIYDVSCLTSLSQLTTLTLNGTFPKNISKLASCQSLDTVKCANTTASDSDIYELKNAGITVVTK